MREQPLFQAGEKYQGELEPLGRMQCHHLYRRPARGLVLASLEGGVIEELVKFRLFLLGFSSRVHGESSCCPELPARSDEFLQVFLARQSTFARLLAVVFQQPAGIDAVAGNLVQSRVLQPLRHRIDLVDEVAQHGRHPAADLAARDAVFRRLPEGYLACPGQRAHAVDGPFANAPGRRIDHPLEGDIRVALVHQPHVGQRVLDFGPLEEAQTPVDAIRDVGHQKGLFQYARLRIRSVEHRDFVWLAIPQPLAGALRHESRFVDFVERGVDLDRLAVSRGSPQGLAEAAPVVADQPVGRVQDLAGRAIVLFQPNDLRVLEIIGEPLNVLDLGAAPTIDRLVVVPHGHDIAGVPGKQPQPRVLNRVRVLELIDQ